MTPSGHTVMLLSLNHMRLILNSYVSEVRYNIGTDSMRQASVHVICLAAHKFSISYVYASALH